MTTPASDDPTPSGPSGDAGPNGEARAARSRAGYDPLPLDSDLEVDEGTARAPRPVHVSPAYLVLVALGGAVGTAAREALTLAVPSLGAFPLAVFGINLLGAFLLGVLLESLVRRGPDVGTRRALRLLLGTGVLGGFTTYSTLATDAASLIAGGQAAVGVAYALATLVLGALATWGGIRLAGLIARNGAER